MLGAMVLDPCMRKEAPAKVCLIVRHHWKYNQCDSDSACVAKMIPYLLGTLAREILNEIPDIVKNTEI